MWQISPLTSLSLFGLVIYIFIFAIVIQRRNLPGNLQFSLMLFFMILWLISGTLEISLNSLQAMQILRELKILFKILAVYAWFAFILEFIGHSTRRSKLIFVTYLIFPLLGLVFILIDHFSGTHFFFSNTQSVIFPSFSLLRVSPGWILKMDTVATLLLFAGTYAIVLKHFKNLSDMYKKQIIVLCIALFIPLLSQIPAFIIHPTPAVDLTPITLLIAALLIIFDIGKHHLLEIIPAARNAVFENLRDIVVVLDNLNRISDLNPLAVKALGGNRKKLINLSAEKALPFLSRLRDFIDPQTGMISEIPILVSGEERFFELQILPISNAKGRVSGTLIFLHDATARVEAESVAKKEQVLRQENETILIQQSKLAAMGEMLGAIAHQWRQPLNALGLIVQDIQDAYAYKELDEAYLEKSVENAMKQLHHLSSTIDDFRNFFRSDKKKQVFSVPESVLEVIALVSKQLENLSIAISLGVRKDHRTLSFEKGDPSDPFLSEGFQNEFKQALMTLIQNAKDAILSHKQKLPSLKGEIKIEVSSDEETCTISVMDNGTGIPEKIIDRIFEPYFTTKDDDQGTGIGLYMSKIIIENNLRGELFARNLESGGACFAIRLSRYLKSPENQA